MKLDQNRTPLFDALSHYAFNDSVTSFDVPGHKKGKGISSRFKELVGENIFKFDPNSMKELDLLSNPTSVIKDAEALLADFFGAENAFMLVNGSTSGIQNMIIAACNERDKIIMPRNIHKSAVNALVLSGAIPVFINADLSDDYQISNGVSFDDVKQVIDDNPDAKAMLLVSPTYFGVSSDLEKIIDYAHQKDIVVLIDESHGSHFSVFEGVSKNAMYYKADLATISVHKTGGSLTQSSVLLHQGSLIDKDKVRQVINLSQTSSASYLLMASIDIARHELFLNQKKNNQLVKLSEELINKINTLDGLQALSHAEENGSTVFKTDPTKIVVKVNDLGLSGFEAYDLLRSDYNIQMELGETNVVLAIVSVGDDKETLDTLYKAFKKISEKYCGNIKKRVTKNSFNKIPEYAVSPRKAFFTQKEFVLLDDAVGKISGDSIMYYPPGIPLLIPGERICQDIVDFYKVVIREKNVILGTKDINNNTYISVLKEEEYE